MKSSVLLFLTLFITLFLGNCKKITKKINAERPFVIYFANPDGTVKSECFDRVYGLNNTNLKLCSEGTTGFELPLSINSASSTFLFQKASVTDTVTIHYSKFYQSGTVEYEVVFKLKSISSSFDSVSTQCPAELSTYCNGYNGLFAVIYI